MSRHNGSRSAIRKPYRLLAVLLLCGGCTVGPDFQRPQAPLNPQWSPQGDPRVLAERTMDQLWWQTFNDPVLDQFVQAAYEQNLPLQIAGLRILESRAALGLAIGGQFPQQQELFGAVTKVGSSKNAATGLGLERDFWDYQLGFDAAWELDFWGKFRRDVQAAQASLMASAADYDNALVSLTAEVARTYVVIRTTEVLIQLTNENARLQEEGLTIAQARFNNGVTTELDVMQARTLLESTRAAIPELQTQLRQAQNALSTLIGQPTGSVQQLLMESRPIPVAPIETAVGLPAELLRRRPDIRAAELYAAAQCARIGIAKADLYPSFSLVGDIGFQSSSHAGIQSGNADFKNLLDSDSLFYSVGPGFAWPIFNYGRIENNVRIQDALFQQLLVNYQDTVLRAAQEVEDSLVGFLDAQETQEFRLNSVNAAKRSVEIAMTQYREGAVDYQRVIDTQRVLQEQQINLAQASSSIATYYIALYKALGGGWELRNGQPFVADQAADQMRRRTDWGGLLPVPPLPVDPVEPPDAQDIPILPQPQW